MLLLPNKARVRAALLDKLEERIEVMKTSAETTREGATHEESRAENDKDTRGLEASYLARGQAKRVVELQDDLAAIRHLPNRSFGPSEPISEGALILVEVDERHQCFLMVRRGGGVRVEVDGIEVQVLSPSSPVGRALLGCQQGDDFRLQVGGKLREYLVEQVV
jgi:transcription elongation GreA/GreB family factor